MTKRAPRRIVAGVDVRATHLVELRGASWPALLSLAALAREAPERHRIVLLGGTALARRAAEHGLRSCDRLSPAFGAPALASRAFARYLNERGASDVIVAWSPRAAALARRARPALPVAAVLSSPPPPFQRDAPGTFAARALRHAALLVYPSKYLRDAWVARYTLLGAPSIVLQPMVEPDRLASVDRARVRRDWGIADDVIVLTGLGEPDEAIDARMLAHRAATMWVAGIKFAVLASAHAGQLERALRFGERFVPRVPVIVDDRPLPDILPACDLGMWSDRPPGPAAPHSRYSAAVGTVSLTWAAAAGLRIAARDHPASREALGGVERVVFVRTPGPAADARAMLALLRDGSPRRPGSAGSEPADWIARFEEALARAVRRAPALVFSA